MTPRTARNIKRGIGVFVLLAFGWAMLLYLAFSVGLGVIVSFFAAVASYLDDRMYPSRFGYPRSYWRCFKDDLKTWL